MTKEAVQKMSSSEILERLQNAANRHYSAELVKDFMDTYAEQIAKERERETSIAFAEWCNTKGWTYDYGHEMWFSKHELPYNTSELYTIFLNDKKK